MRQPLSQDLLLCCWNDQRGKLATDWSGSVPAGVAGATLLDAVLDGVVTVQDGRAHATGKQATDPLMADLVGAITRRRRPPKAKTLVSNVGNSKRVRSLRDRMVREGVLDEHQDKVLGMFPVTRQKPADPVAAARLRERVHALLTGAVRPRDADDRDVILAALAGITVALDVLVARPDRKAAKKRAESFRDSSGVSEAVADAIRDTQAAVTTSIIAAGAASSASS